MFFVLGIPSKTSFQVGLKTFLLMFVASIQLRKVYRDLLSF